MTNKHPDDPATTPQAAASNEYVSHNFDAVNHAIETDVARRDLTYALYQAELKTNRVNTLLYASVSLSIFIVALAFVWWLLFQPKAQLHADIGALQERMESASPIASLEVLSKNEQQRQLALDEAEQTFIDTSFTVFSRAIISTGEYVVTGKTYAPDDLRTPTEQYCYLEQAQSSASLSGLPLAIVENGKFVAETQDPALIKLARRHCQFTTHR